MPGDTTSIPASSGLQVPQPGYATVPTQTRPLQAADYGPMLQAIEMAGKNIMNSDLNPENFAKARANIAAANVVPDVISAYRNAPGGSLLPYVTNIQGNVPQIGFAGLPAGTAQLIAQRMGLIPQTPGGNGGGKKEVAPGTGREGGEESPNATEEQKTPEDKSNAASMGGD